MIVHEQIACKNQVLRKM